MNSGLNYTVPLLPWLVVVRIVFKELISMIFRHYLFANITEAPKSRSDIEENREMSNWTACPVRVLLHKKNTIF